MAQKASPYAIRLGYNQDWNTYFFAENKEEQITFLKRDKAIRDYIHSYVTFLDIAQLKTEYTKNSISIRLYVPRVDVALGERGGELESVLKGLYQIISDDKVAVKLDLVKIKNHAQLLANLITEQLKKRTRSRQIIRSIAKQVATEREAKGLTIRINGLIDGSEIAQKKRFTQGRMKLSSIDSNIEEGEAEAFMGRGVAGVKVLLYKGKI
jgi:ribosomal protein S3